MAQDSIDKVITITFKSSDLVKQWEELTAEIEKTKAATKNLNKEDADYYKQVAKNKAQLRELTRQQKQVQKELDNNIKLEKTEKGSLSQMRAEVKSLTAEYERLSAAERKGSRGTEILKNIQSTTAEINKQEAAMRNYRANVGNYAGGIQKAFAKIGAAWMAVKGIYRLFSSSINTIKDFEQANANLGTILGASKTEMDALRESALELGRTTEYTASQVTLLQTELAKLGFGPQAIQAMQEPILHFATAVGAQLPEAAKLAGATLRIFGLNANQTEDTLDVLATATNKSALSFEYLNNAMSTVGPVAKTFGFSVRDTTALLASLANSGFEASTAATATRNILLNLADTNGKLAQSLGGPVKTLPELVDGLKKLKKQGVDLASTLELTDKRSVAAFNTFLNGADSVQELRDAFEDVGGTAKRIAEERLNTVEGSIKLMQSAWEGFVLSFYNSKGTLKTVIDWFTAAITGISDLMLGKEGRRQRDERTTVASITKTVNKRFTQAFSETSGPDIEKRIEDATGKIREKLKKEMDEIWGGIIDQDTINKAIEDALTTSANAVRESEVAATKTLKILSGKELKELDKIARQNAKIIVEAENQTLKITQQMREKTRDNELLTLKENYDKEARLLQNKIDNDATLSAEAQAALSQQLLVMEEQYQQQRQSIIDKWSQKELDEQIKNKEQEYRNRLLAAKISGGRKGEIAEARAIAQEELRIAREKYAELLALDEKAKKARKMSDEEYKTAKLNAELAIQNAIKKTSQIEKEERKKISDETNVALSKASELASNLSAAFDALGEEGERYAAFTKAFAVMSVVLAQAQAIANAVASGSKAPWFMVPLAIASAVAAVTAAIAQSVNTANSTQTPKYADGGLVTGPGTGTSDSITARISNGEAVMTAAAVADWGAVLSAINVSSGGNPIDTSHLPSNSGGGMDQLEEMMNRVILNMKQPVVSVVDINRGQNRVKVSENIGRLGRRNKK